MSATPKQDDDEKQGHHPRSRHRSRYDFERLTAALPALAPLVSKNVHGDPTIDFADPAAVRALNTAILVSEYGVSSWELPPDALCPPIPGRADHVHAVADLLKDAAGNVPTGDAVTVLDIGVGASCIYPIIGRHVYGWRFVGTDTDAVALESARAIVAANPGLCGGVELRSPADPSDIFKGVVLPDERFAVTMCNPPFHTSAEEAEGANQRKLRGLAGGPDRGLARTPNRNFGGRSAELWCEGGERGFIKRMIEQSAAFREQCRWFTTLVSRKKTLEGTERALSRAEATDVRILPLKHGQKASRIVAWTFVK